MRSLHMSSISALETQWADMKGREKWPTVNVIFFSTSFMVWYVDRQKEVKTNNAPFCEPNTKQCMALQWTKNNQVEMTKERCKRKENQITKWEEEEVVTGCNVWEVITSEDSCAMEDETKRLFDIKYLSPWGLLQLVRERQMYQRDKSRKNDTNN